MLFSKLISPLTPLLMISFTLAGCVSQEVRLAQRTGLAEATRSHLKCAAEYCYDRGVSNADAYGSALRGFAPACMIQRVGLAQKYSVLFGSLSGVRQFDLMAQSRCVDSFREGAKINKECTTLESLIGYETREKELQELKRDYANTCEIATSRRSYLPG